MLTAFADELASIRVLDPACGSGNFLYVALRRLLDLQKEVIAYAARRGLPAIPLTVGPEQLYGIEINEYAHELAQVTVWIGYLQWRHENGFDEMADPVLRPLTNIKRMDAILAHDEAGRPVEPEWPAAEVIIGNPPFLGDKKMRAELGLEYVKIVRSIYSNKIPGQSDLVCYWFEKARMMVACGNTSRVGLLATNSIRGGANQTVLNRIKQTGDIFMAWSDRPWVLDGAAVRVSMVGFDNGSEKVRTLDGKSSSTISSDLSGGIDLSIAEPLSENLNISFIGSQKGGDFDIDKLLAQKMLAATNTDLHKKNSDVIRPWINGLDITRSPRGMYIIDFGVDQSEDEARGYELPFQYIEEMVRPTRESIRSEENTATKWWLHQRPRPDMRLAMLNLDRFIATPRVSKHRVFVWQPVEVLADSAVVAIARDDDYFFGVLHSRPHELWSLRMGTWLGVGNDPRYTPTTTFETFPFPWPPGREPRPDLTGFGNLSGLEGPERVAAIAHWARELVRWRDAWLNPPPPAKGTLDVAYDRLIKARTLTNLYNGLVYYRATRPDRSARAISSGTSLERRPVRSHVPFDRAAFDKETRKSVSPAEIQELDDIHRALDSAVFRAYGWPDDLSDEAILERLLALNLARAGR